MSLALHFLLVALTFFGIPLIGGSDWVSCYLVVWILSAWFTVIGAISYINKFYRFNKTVIMYITIGFLLPILRYGAVYYGCTHSITITSAEKFVHLSLIGFYIAIYFFCLALCFLVDTSFVLNKTILVHPFPNL